MIADGGKIARRDVLAGLGGLTFAGAARAAEVKFAVPDGACDCHHHIYDPRFPYLPDAALKPPFATTTDYRNIAGRLHISRNIAVQPSTYGTDNRCLVDFLKQMGPAARGVCVVNATIGDADLKTLHAAGVRGIRIQFGVGRAPVEEAEIVPLARRIAPMGWHMQFNLPPEQLVRMEKLIAGLPIPVIIDHLGRATDTVSDHYKVVRRLLDSGHGWVKLSGAYLYGSKGPPDYADASSAARAYLAAHPERCVWGSDWPHPDATSGRVAMPDDVVLLDLLAAWAPDPKLRYRVLVENPESFYGFNPRQRPKG
jgi:predicted TIM-barrel fold metal-dependent hydrolase